MVKNIVEIILGVTFCLWDIIDTHDKLSHKINVGIGLQTKKQQQPKKNSQNFTSELIVQSL